jgi:ATP-dependent Lon protease
MTHGREQVAVFASRIDTLLDSGTEPLHDVGTLAQVGSLERSHGCDHMVADLEGLERVRLVRWSATPSNALCTRMSTDPLSATTYALARAVCSVIRRIQDEFSNCMHVRRAVDELAEAGNPAQVLGAASALLFDLPTFHRQELLELEPLDAQLEEVLAALHEKLARLSRTRPNAAAS